jgi:hypothetical protein
MSNTLDVLLVAVSEYTARGQTGTPSMGPSLADVRTPGLITGFNNISRGLRGHGEIPEELAIDDLKLLHHFTTKTYATLDSVVSKQHIWRESAVQIGFQYPFLLRGILGISALKPRNTEPGFERKFRHSSIEPV